MTQGEPFHPWVNLNKVALHPHSFWPAMALGVALLQRIRPGRICVDSQGGGSKGARLVARKRQIPPPIESTMPSNLAMVQSLQLCHFLTFQSH